MEQLDMFAPPPILEDPEDDAADDVERVELLAARPRMRGDCLAGGVNAQRPCPWATCRHHLLVELTAPNGDHSIAGEVAGLVVRHAATRPQPSLVLNRSGRVGVRGRPPTLAPDASAREVEAFTVAAVEQLESMPETCALDVASRGCMPEDPSRGRGNTDEDIAAILGLHTEAVINAESEAGAQWRGKAYEGGMRPPATLPRTLRRLEGETPVQAIERARAWSWWPRVVDEEPEASESRWTWLVFESVDVEEGLRCAAESVNREEPR